MTSVTSRRIMHPSLWVTAGAAPGSASVFRDINLTLEAYRVSTGPMRDGPLTLCAAAFGLRLG